MQTVSLTAASYGSAIFHSLTSIVRYCYVKSSLVQDVQHILKKDSFIIQSVLLGEFQLLCHIVSAYRYLVQSDVPRVPLILYKACVDPWDKSTIPFWQIAPVSQGMLHLNNTINILCNIWLYKFLDSSTKKNSALKGEHWWRTIIQGWKDLGKTNSFAFLVF